MDQEWEFEENIGYVQLLEVTKFGLMELLWCCVSFVLFLVKPSSNTTSIN